MQNNFSKQTSTKFKVLGIYQIAGGIIGLILTSWLIGQRHAFSIIVIMLFAIAIALYCYSIYCGTLLVMQKVAGLTHSLVNQFLQLVSFSIAGYIFQYTSGIFVSVGIDLTNSLSYKLDFGTSVWRLGFYTGADVFLINFNVTALYLIIFLDKFKKKVHYEQFDKVIEHLGEK
jgi:hypothetical protein